MRSDCTGEPPGLAMSSTRCCGRPRGADRALDRGAHALDVEIGRAGESVPCSSSTGMRGRRQKSRFMPGDRGWRAGLARLWFGRCARPAGMKDVDVVVVGAGIAGLGGGAWLRRAGFSVELIEATERIGGRAHTIRPALLGGAMLDAGASWLHAAERNPLVPIAREAGETLRRSALDRATAPLSATGSRPRRSSPPMRPEARLPRRHGSAARAGRM